MERICRLLLIAPEVRPNDLHIQTAGNRKVESEDRILVRSNVACDSSAEFPIPVNDFVCIADGVGGNVLQATQNIFWRHVPIFRSFTIDLGRSGYLRLFQVVFFELLNFYCTLPSFHVITPFRYVNVKIVTELEIIRKLLGFLMNRFFPFYFSTYTSKYRQSFLKRWLLLVLRLPVLRPAMGTPEKALPSQ